VESVTPVIEHPTATLLLALDGGEVVGSLVAAFDGWRGNMYRLAVRPDARRRGVAQALVGAGHERLRAFGARRVTALVDAEEVAATALWRAAGYEHDPVHGRLVRNI
jgi:ribosomal protein S18 acetylase RimI-like enzyme